MSYSFSFTSSINEKPRSTASSKFSRSYMTATVITALSMTASLPVGATSPHGAPSQLSVRTAPVASAPIFGKHTATQYSSQVERSSQKQVSSISALRELSGLTTAQLGRLFGVSRRSIHNWIAGATMSAANAERLSELIRVVSAVGSSPAERRQKLLDSSKGMSIFHTLVARAADTNNLQPTPFSVRSQFSA